MKNIKIYKQVTALTIASFMAFSLAGCSKNYKKSDVIYGKQNPTTISIEKTKEQKNEEESIKFCEPKIENMLKIQDKNYANYMYCLDMNKLQKEGYSFPKEKRYLYIVEGKTFVENQEQAKQEVNTVNMTKATFKNENTYIVPEAYEWATDCFTNCYKNHPIIKIYELKDDYGENYLYYEYKTEFIEDINKQIIETEEVYKYKQIKKGDYLKYTALYTSINGELIKIADNQTGMGAECNNVQEKITGNLTEKLLSPIKENAKINPQQTQKIKIRK